ncbi:uncharacterized protein LOC131672983 [Phymastichus coffea]|uniref:uncharacterized protein LOC131672983 n=1 Tax=Phymastichus coffea TaxID=108790 RepID=UPI00273AB8EB|nr:uncharacterized protein LOC131672983 [Phymastichus coffea]
MKLAQLLLLVVCLAALARAQQRQPSNRPGRFLSLPVPQKCANRPKAFQFRGRNMFFSGHVPQHANQKVDWLDARNICREYCMDLVSIESQEKNNLIFKLIQQNDVPYIWTSGRVCDFKGCEGRRDLEPKNIFGWFWSANREKMAPTNQIPAGFNFNPWSQTGHKKQRQPDNAEFDINGTNESCLAVLNNVYNDGIAWHDVACYHEKPFVCEDSDELLNYVASTNRGIRL